MGFIASLARVHVLRQVRAELMHAVGLLPRAYVLRFIDEQRARTTLLALDVLATRYREQAPGARSLRQAELKVFSQNGEDGVLQAILARIGEGSRTFVEIGVQTGAECNAAFLASVLDWSGVFVESDARSFALLADRYADAHRVTTVHAHVTTDNVNEVLAVAPPEPDVLSIDIDGADYWVWDAITAITPRVVVIEYNAALPRTSRLVQPRDRDRPWDGTDRFGASLGALEALGRRKGYVLVHTELAGVNAFFVHERDAQHFDETADPARRSPNYQLNDARHATRG